VSKCVLPIQLLCANKKEKYLSIITLNVNTLKSPIKRHRLVDWTRKQDPTICCQHETHSIGKDTQVEAERMENNIPSKWKSKANRNNYIHIRYNKL
jgi:exonuclease III